MRIPVLAVSSLSLATSLAFAAPVELNDTQLERIAAGTSEFDPGSAAQRSGGAIVGNSSTATLSTSGDVTLGDAVQQGARGVNLANSAESSIANGVNLWDGRLDTQTTATGFGVQQSNTIAQDQSRMASLPNYVRSGPNTVQTSSSTSDTTHTGSVDTAQHILGQELQGGMGVSIAGQVDANLTGGSISLTNHIGGTFDGHFDANAVFGLAGTDADTHITANTDQSLVWVLPDLTLSLKGAGCYVEIGSCDASGSYSNTSTETSISSSPFTLQNAAAEYIVVDGSTLDATSEYTVALSGDAQKDLRAVNLANAAGSVVANAVNISRTPTVGPDLNLSQVNVIVQRR
jgi:hypothetical protein